MLPTEKQYVHWQDGQQLQSALWLSESNQPAPTRTVLVDDQTKADDAYRLACEGNSLLWRGDFHNARQLKTDLFPTEQPLAELIVCNPPWLPAKPSSPLEFAVYDANSSMLRGFLQGAGAYLAPQGEVWLILSDLAELLELRSREELLGWFTEANLMVKYRLDTQPKHGRSKDSSDPLHSARSTETTPLWCLVSE